MGVERCKGWRRGRERCKEEELCEQNNLSICRVEEHQNGIRIVEKEGAGEDREMIRVARRS